MSPVIAIGIAITALGLLGISMAMLPRLKMRYAVADRLFVGGFYVLTISFGYWLVLSVANFLAVAKHGL